MKRTLILGAILALALAITGTAAAASMSGKGTARLTTTNQACQAGSGCFALKGGFHGTPVTGVVEGTLTVDRSQGGKCAPAGGALILSNSGSDALNLTSTGTMCRHGAGVQTYSGSWNIMSGSGKYASSGVGSGKLSLKQLPNGLVRVAVTGSFSMENRPAQ